MREDLSIRLIATDVDGTMLDSRGMMTDENLRAIQNAQEKGITVAQLVLIYFYHQSFPAIPITSFSNDGQMDEAMAAADLSLTDEEYTFLTSPID